ncbi:hypothetical protein IWW48_002362 [Coemansia sp. RSA 1200]|nr:hypothetical protein IWW48_002362 [Coemansia sp. RSA 1200]
MATFIPFNGKGLIHFNHVGNEYQCNFCAKTFKTFEVYEKHWPVCTGVCKERAFRVFDVSSWSQFPRQQQQQPSSSSGKTGAGSQPAKKKADGGGANNNNNSKQPAANTNSKQPAANTNSKQPATNTDNGSQNKGKGKKKK